MVFKCGIRFFVYKNANFGPQCTFKKKLFYTGLTLVFGFKLHFSTGKIEEKNCDLTVLKMRLQSLKKCLI